MALSYPPCLGEARIVVRPTSNFLSFTAYSDKLSASLCFRTPFWSIGTRKYQQRRYRKSFLLPSQKHAIKTSQKLWRVRAGPTASLAQSSQMVVASETILSFSYIPPTLNHEDGDGDGDGDGNGDGGMAHNGSTSVVDVRELKRRERIARANKGKVPWNKGRQHSPETIAKIRERTKKAMLNPKVREKLRNFGKNLSVETKAKIREKMVGVWESKKLVKRAQDTMFKEWKELVANAARVGDSDDEEHEWNTYSKLSTQLRRDVFDAARRAKQVVVGQQKANKQARKAVGVSEAHRKAISDAIKAKWEDPEYRARVFAGMQKIDPATRIRSTQKKTQKKSATPKQKALVLDDEEVVAAAEEVPVPVSGEKRKVSVAPAVIDEDFIAEVLAEEVTAKSRSESATAARIKGPQKVTLVRLEDNSFGVAGDKEEAVIESQIVQLKDAILPVKGETVQADSTQSISVGKKNVEKTVMQPSQVSYKDPLVHEKLQKIKQLREGRLEVEAKRKEAANRARMLIADAERAANALERAAKTDKATMATLIETRRLIADATRSMQAAERGRTPDGDANTDLSEPKHMASLKTSPHPKSSDVKEDEEISALSIGSDFHRWVWTSSNDMVECPHPIPLRVSDLRSGNLELRMSELKEKIQNVRSGSVGGLVSNLPDLSRNTKPTFEASPGNQEHDQIGKAEPYLRVVEESLQSKDGQGFPLHSSSSSSGKKWVRGRLVSTEEENRT